MAKGPSKGAKAKIISGGASRGAKKDLFRDPEKERVINELTKALGATGIVVRREKLKRGPGWRVVSGICRAVIGSPKVAEGVVSDVTSPTAGASQVAVPAQFVFVDRALPQEDQITFLCARLEESCRRGSKVSLSAELFERLPAAGKALVAALVSA